MKTLRKESKECRYRLRPIDLRGDADLEKERMRLVRESTELMKILGAILRNSSQ